MTKTTILLPLTITSITLIGLALGAVTRDVTTGRHSLRDRLFINPLQISDDLEDQLHELRVHNETSLSSLITSSESSSSSSEAPRSVEQSTSVETSREDLSSVKSPSTFAVAADDVSHEQTASREQERAWPQALRLQESEEETATSNLQFEKQDDSSALASTSSRVVTSHQQTSNENINKEETVGDQEGHGSDSDSEEESEETEEEVQDSDEKSPSTSSPTTSPTQEHEPSTSTTPPPRKHLPYGLRNLASEKRDSQSSDTRMLQLMMQLAQNPAQWERVHHELEHLDHELLASRNAVQMLALARAQPLKPIPEKNDDIVEVTTEHQSTAEINSVKEQVPPEHTEDKTQLPERQKLNSDSSIAGKHAKILQLPKNTFENDNREVNAEMPQPLILENEAERVSQAVPSETPHHHHHHGNGKHDWSQFSYHRVTANPAETLSLSHGRHHNAFIAVSAVTPPKLRVKQQHPTATPESHPIEHHETDHESHHEPHHEPLPDAMDTLLAKIPLHRVTSLSTSKETKEVPSSPGKVDEEEREIEDLVQTGWNHEQHREQLQEQLHALESLHAQLKAKWLQLSHEHPTSQHQTQGPKHTQ